MHTVNSNNPEYARSLIEASLDPLFVVNANGIITDMNEATLRMTGLSRDAITSSNFFDHFTNQTTAEELYLRVFENGSVVDAPLIMRSAGGKLTDILFNGSVYRDAQNIIRGVVVVARDVTEKKKNSENLLGFLDSVPDAIVIVNREGKIKLINSQTTELFGYQRSQLMDQTLDLLIPEKYKEFHLAHKGHFGIMPDMRHMGGDLNIFGKNKNGSEFPVEISLNQFETEEGIFVSAAIRNISKQKEASQYARSLLESSLDPLVTISAKGKITDVNEASVKVTGIERSCLIGTDFSDYFTEPEMANQAYQEVFNKGFVADFPLTIKSRNGELVHVLYNASLYKDNNGKVLGVFAAARDITKQKQSSHYARSLIEASLDPLVTINTEGKITDMNDAMLKATDRSRAELTDTDFKNYFIETEKADQVFKDVFANGTVQNFPLTIIDGILTDVLLNGSVYKDEQGNIIGAVLVSRDITELKRIETELTVAKVMAELATLLAEEAKLKAEKATTVAEDAVKSKQQFLSNMSHEIRTPMNAIIGFTRVVLKTDLTNKQKEYLNAIKSSGDTMISLINDILDLAKVDAGKMAFEQTPMQLKHSVSSMLQLFETRVQEKNLQLVIEYDDTIPGVLLGDSIRLNQILINLISNAVKFTIAGKITLCIKLLEENESLARIEFSVTDTGIGISETNQIRIFDNFQQASSDTSRLYGGTGLGLAIVKQLVESQHGTLNVKSAPDEGSTFSFILPFLKTDLPFNEINETEEKKSNTLQIKVLVAEDILLNQLLMKTVLDDFGFERDIASNGLIAIEMMQAKTYDIVLMDLQMPEMNGFEATDHIRKVMNSKIPIIALTADVTTMDRDKCKAAGMDDYLAKPLDEKLLYSKIMALVKKTSKLKVDERDQNNPVAEDQIRYTNLDYIKKITKSDKKLMAEIIELYLAQTPELIQLMKKSMLERNWKLLNSSVHKIIPSFMIVGINKDYEMMAKKIQDFSGNQLSEIGIPDMISQLDVVCTNACLELKDYLLDMEYNKK